MENMQKQVILYIFYKIQQTIYLFWATLSFPVDKNAKMELWRREFLLNWQSNCNVKEAYIVKNTLLHTAFSAILPEEHLFYFQSFK